MRLITVFRILKITIFKLIIKTIYLTNTNHLLKYFKRDKVIILMYHGVSKKEFQGLENFDGKHTDVNKFLWQIKYLTKYYNIISMHKFVDSILKDKLFPKNTIVITFDDGYQNVFENAYPILKEYKIPATIFPISNLINTQISPWFDNIEHIINLTNRKIINIKINNKRYIFNLNNKKQKINTLIKLKEILKNINHKNRIKIITKLHIQLKIKTQPFNNYKILNWENLRIMINNGFEVGGHSLNHDLLTNLSSKNVERDILLTKQIIKKNLSKKIVHFAYPRGAFNPNIKKILRKNEFVCALTTIEGYNSHNTDLFELRRIDINNNISNEEFVWKLVKNYKEQLLEK